MENKKKILSCILAISIFLNTFGCNYKEKDNSDNKEIIASSADSLDKKDEDDVTLTFDYHKYFQEFRPNYRFDVPIVEDKIREIMDYEPKPCSFVFDGNIKKLINKIKKNSKETSEEQYYIFTDDYFGITADNFEEKINEIYTKYQTDLESNSELQNKIVADIAIEYCLDYYMQSSTSDINEDMCNFETLKIVGNTNSDKTVLGEYSNKTNTIEIYFENIFYFLDFYYSSYEHSNYDNFCFLVESFIKNLQHELNHVRQAMCRHRINENDSNLFDIDWLGSKNNQTYKYISKSFLIEASAESATYNEEEKESIIPLGYYYTYREERSDEALMLLLGLTNGNQYYEAIFNTNLNDLYKYLGCQSYDDYVRVYRIIYILERKHGNYITSEEEKNENYSDFIKNIHLDFKTDIFSLVLSNLCDYSFKNPDFSLDEHIYLYSLISEIILNNDYPIDTNTLKVDIANLYDKEFIDDFFKLDQVYIRYLAEKYTLSVEEVEQKLKDANDDLYYASYYFYYDFIQKKEPFTKLLQRFPSLKLILFSSNIENLYDFYLDYYNNKQAVDNKLILNKRVVKNFVE